MRRGDPRYRGRHERRLRPDARSRRHRHGGQRVVSVNTLFWKILVTRVKRKIVVVSHHRKEAPKKSPRRIIAPQAKRSAIWLLPVHQWREVGMPMRGPNCVGILKLWTAQPRPAAAKSARIAHRHVVAVAGRRGRYLLFCIRTEHRAVYNIEWQFSALCSSSSTTHLAGVHHQHRHLRQMAISVCKSPAHGRGPHRYSSWCRR
jgi:hypothetical protein